MSTEGILTMRKAGSSVFWKPAGVPFLAVVLLGTAAFAAQQRPSNPSVPALPNRLLSGQVISGYPGLGQRREAGMKVTLYLAGPTSATVLGQATTNDLGRFQMTYRWSSRLAVRYLVAERESGSKAGDRVVLMNVLGSGEHVPVHDKVTLNELTTVSSAYALNQFLHGTAVYGARPGLTNAADLVANLADLTTGAYSEMVINTPNGPDTLTLPTLATLANLLTVCVRGNAADCGKVFVAATPPGGPRPTNTLDAIHDIAQNPSNHLQEIFDLASATGRPEETAEEQAESLQHDIQNFPRLWADRESEIEGTLLPGLAPFRPALKRAPESYLLSLHYVAQGIDSIGNFAFDAKGNAWMANNMDPPGSDPGRVLPALDTNGVLLPSFPRRRGGLHLPAYGIAIGPDNYVWLANLGSKIYGANMSKFSPVGNPISPITGYRQGGLKGPQGPAFDRHGNLWIPNWLLNTVTEYPGGHPERAKIFDVGGIDHPFAIAVDSLDRIWINNDKSVTVLDQSGTPVLRSPIRADWLAGNRSDNFVGGGKDIAIDSQGNAWATNFRSSTVTEIRPDGTLARDHPVVVPFPWGIAVDGNDNVWVANATAGLIEICGERPQTCPKAADGNERHTGDIISTPNGWYNPNMQFLTGVRVDPSGNVWVANNYMRTGGAPNRVQEPLGANAALIFIGVAAPVKTPMLGPPRQPR